MLKTHEIYIPVMALKTDSRVVPTGRLYCLARPSFDLYFGGGGGQFVTTCPVPNWKNVLCQGLDGRSSPPPSYAPAPLLFLLCHGFLGMKGPGVSLFFNTFINVKKNVLYDIQSVYKTIIFRLKRKKDFNESIVFKEQSIFFHPNFTYLFNEQFLS